MLASCKSAGGCSTCKQCRGSDWGGSFCLANYFVSLFLAIAILYFFIAVEIEIEKRFSVEMIFGVYIFLLYIIQNHLIPFRLV
jgi:hypothetical protein